MKSVMRQIVIGTMGNHQFHKDDVTLSVRTETGITSRVAVIANAIRVPIIVDLQEQVPE